MSMAQVLEIQIKYLDQSIEYTEKELTVRREYRERLQMELNRARRLEKELQDGNPKRDPLVGDISKN